jgi:F0F1-type ATP synthase membrane subunit c/vacuolar-type H+-ATPase subunit K
LAVPLHLIFNKKLRSCGKLLQLPFFGNSFNGTVTVTVLYSAIGIVSTLPINGIIPTNDSQVLQFSINGLAPFQLQYVDSQARNNFETNLFFSGIFLGAAVSGFIGLALDFASIQESSKNIKTALHEKVPKKEKESIEENKNAKIFFFGIIVAIFGSFLVGSVFEFARSVFAHDPELITGFYNSMFIGSSIAFWLALAYSSLSKPVSEKKV